MNISETYIKIANDPKFKDETKLRNETKKLLNRARVRMQTIENKKAITSGYISAKERLRSAGLLTAGGNVSLKLPKTRQKLLTVLRQVTDFLDTIDTTLKGQKAKQKQHKEHTQKQNELKKGYNNIKDNLQAEYASKNPEVGVYWGLMKDLGLLNFVKYEDIAEYIEEIRDRIEPMDFERLVLDTIEEADETVFWEDIAKYGITID